MKNGIFFFPSSKSFSTVIYDATLSLHNIHLTKDFGIIKLYPHHLTYTKVYLIQKLSK
jgi:hypothetical protein